jgi:hypothetical protein
MSVPQGAGALYSTTGDLLKREQGLFGGKLLRAASLEEMTTPFKNNYAFGLQVQTVGGHKVIEHGDGAQPDCHVTGRTKPRRDRKAADRAEGDYALFQGAEPLCGRIPNGFGRQHAHHSGEQSTVFEVG